MLAIQSHGPFDLFFVEIIKIKTFKSLRHETIITFYWLEDMLKDANFAKIYTSNIWLMFWGFFGMTNELT